MGNNFLKCVLLGLYMHGLPLQMTEREKFFQMMIHLISQGEDAVHRMS